MESTLFSSCASLLYAIFLSNGLPQFFPPALLCDGWDGESGPSPLFTAKALTAFLRTRLCWIAGGWWGVVRGNGHSDISHTGMWQREVLLVNAVHYCLDSEGLSFSPGHTWLSRWPGWTFSTDCVSHPIIISNANAIGLNVSLLCRANFWHFNKVLRNERSISCKAARITAI